jgi:hypothetical protein
MSLSIRYPASGSFELEYYNVGLISELSRKFLLAIARTAGPQDGQACGAMSSE